MAGSWMNSNRSCFGSPLFDYIAFDQCWAYWIHIQRFSKIWAYSWPTFSCSCCNNPRGGRRGSWTSYSIPAWSLRNGLVDQLPPHFRNCPRVGSGRKLSDNAVFSRATLTTPPTGDLRSYTNGHYSSGVMLNTRNSAKLRYSHFYAWYFPLWSVVNRVHNQTDVLL